MTDRSEEIVSDDMLMALADGEMEDEQAIALRAMINRDRSLAERYAVFTGTAAALRAAYAQTTVPQRLIAAALTAPAGTDTPEIAAAKTGDTVVPFRRQIAWPLALAATLAAGIGIGWGLNMAGGPAGAPGLSHVAEAVSDVTTGEASDVAGFGEARVLGSFETEKGLCRLIAVEPTGDPAGRILACRDGADWQVALSVTVGAGRSFAPASDATTEMIDSYLHNIGAGPALSAEAEERALR
ncbi:hypothetical protein RAZWK3B_16870 [Roseobacter sp. AzwK-3b]|uniref:hypothetical protein n=1 Tax=Roseobacter sp. AzwK-3b TaxID=351016 RepID=UPI00015699D0|nr:hypothetical protein [Roseobacter sp. AzwK-3b]EDM71089.1 hypothetical protein RAZWK3B_16870 [Roseobacter sp. AzwK-3b]